jgi:hypothetical protein
MLNSNIRVKKVQTFYTSKVRLRGESAWQLPGTPTYNGRQDDNEVIGNVVPVKSCFNMRKNFSEHYSRFGHWHSKNGRQPRPKLKTFNP